MSLVVLTAPLVPILKRRKSKVKGFDRAKWTMNQKLQVVSTYLMVGSLVQTSLITGVPVGTMEKWKLSDWWKEFVLKLQSEDAQELDSSMKKIVDKALKAVEDRLDNGDALYDYRSGEVKRIPVKAQAALKITTDLLTKQEIIRKAPQQKDLEKTIDDRLLKLAEEFSKFAKSPPKNVDKERTLDIPMVEIVGDDKT